MQQYERFGECLKRCLKDANLSASEASRLAGFRSRNSIFRILSGETSWEINWRFMETLYKAVGDQWPRERWMALQEALNIDRLGPERYEANRAFRRVMHGHEAGIPNCTLLEIGPDGEEKQRPLAEALAEIAAAARAEIVITGCCDAGLSSLLVEACGAAGAQGTLSIRHYIDTAKETVCQNILGVLPLLTKSWYNARLVAPGSCPEEMMAIYRLNAMHIHKWDASGRQTNVMLIRYDEHSFASRGEMVGRSAAIGVLDRWRFHLELLKPMAAIHQGPQMFVTYTRQFLDLEENSVILSIKPDVHFNCIPRVALEKAVMDGLESSGLMNGADPTALIQSLCQVHDARYDNIMHKHKPTHLVYSLPMMEQFMRTGMTSDHFFLRGAYTVAERRLIIRGLLVAMRDSPYFNVHFLRKEIPSLHYEITYYGDRGVMLTDAYADYGLDAEHTEALITLPAFMEGFYRYYLDELMNHYVMTRGETILALDGLLYMDIQDES